MNNITTYIFEKLRINKDTKVKDTNNKYIEEILEIIHPTKDVEKISEKISLWLSDYDKKLYCYVSDVDYKHRYKNITKLDNISINPINIGLMIKAEKNANQSSIYKSDTNNISEIRLSQYDLCVYYCGGWSTVIFEKSK